MSDRKTKLLSTVFALTAGTWMLLGTAPAHADTTSDLLDKLVSKGVLSRTEATQLQRENRTETTVTRRDRRGRVVATRRGPTASESEAVISAERANQAAQAAAASAAAATATAAAVESDTTIVRAKPYVGGKGIGIRVGQIDLNFSGIINGFYSYSSAGRAGSAIGGGLADGSGRDTSSVRNGLLPGALIFNASTTQGGIDLGVTIGFFPGLNNLSTKGPINANNGGSSVALGTPGIDARKIFLTAGTKQFGTVKVGRDIGIFASDAILNDITLLGVGSSQGNFAPANTSLGRIGLGYIYTDFQPQISYESPLWHNLQGTVGVFQPLDEFNFSGFSGTNTAHQIPQFQGKVTYDYKTPAVSGRVWSGFLVQPQDRASGGIEGIDRSRSNVAYALDVGTKIGFGPVSLVGYYYHATGVGTTGAFFDGVATNGEQRDSDGYYFQGVFQATPKLKLGASYGVSNLYQARGENSPGLVRRNESEVGGAYYSLTDWLTVVGEYTHSTSNSHSRLSADQDNFTGGAIVFF